MTSEEIEAKVAGQHARFTAERSAWRAQYAGKWLAYLDGEILHVASTRREAIAWLLKNTKPDSGAIVEPADEQAPVLLSAAFAFRPPR